MTLKAYAVQEEDENTGGIVFAKSNAQARREGSQAFGDGDFNWGRARRAPWADPYAPGPVPPLVMIDHGWWFHCLGCDRRVTDDSFGYEDDYEIGPERAVEVGNCVYCSPECKCTHELNRALRERAEASAVSRARANIKRMFPGATFADGYEHGHAYAVPFMGGYTARSLRVHFNFPGQTIGPALYAIDGVLAEPKITVCKGDVDAWDQWREGGYR